MEGYILAIFGMLIPIIIVPTALGLKHARMLRQLEHVERMKALEMGQSLTEGPSFTPGSVALSIGAGVPVAAMFIAFIAAPKQGGGDTIWLAAAMIGVAGVICGSILAFQAVARQGQTASNFPNEKPEFDPEAFDVVGRRG